MEGLEEDNGSNRVNLEMSADLGGRRLKHRSDDVEEPGVRDQDVDVRDSVLGSEFGGCSSGVAVDGGVDFHDD